MRGFTLIEALVYVAILGIVSAGSITLLFNLDDLFFQYRVQQELFSSGTATLDRILTELRQAESIELAQSELATSTIGALTLVSDATTTSVALLDGDLQITVNGEVEGLLNSSLVTVDGFTVFHYSLARSDLVRVRLVLSANQGEYTETLTLAGAAVIRGTYD